MNFVFRMLAVLGTLVGLSAGEKSLESQSHPNIVLVTIDTVRADHVGCYGGKGVSTSTLDGLAKDGIMFQRAISQVPLTFPSHAAILTGLYPFQTGAQDFTSPPLASGYRTIAEALRAHGYSTGAVVSSFALDHSWGLGQGFSLYDDAFSQKAYKDREMGIVERKAGESVDHALHWLQKPRRQPFFLWLHLYDPHSPYNPPEPFHTEYAQHLYDGEIAYADRELGRLIGWLKRSQLYDGSLVIVVSDHGESLGDHGEKEHGFFLYNSTLHVPLIIKPPKRSRYKIGVNQNLVEISAIPSMILGIAGVDDVLGRGANSLGQEKPDSRGAYSETFYPFNSFGWSPLHSIQTSRFHFIDAPSPELYDVTTDPEEKNNLVMSQKATAEVLKEKLAAILQAGATKTASKETSTISLEAQQKLRALGYFSYRSEVPESALLNGLPDPKAKLSEFNLLLEAQDALHSGDVERGQILLNSISQKDGGLYIVPFYLGEAALSLNEWGQASSAFRRCLDLNPNFEQAMTGLARALTFQGKVDEAKDWALKALTLNPESYKAFYYLGFLESSRDRKQAIIYYKKAVAIESSYAPLQRDLGTLELQEGEFFDSTTHLENAVRLGLNDDPSLLNSLGLAYGRTNRLEKSAEAYKKAIELKPDAPEIHLNLATAYQRLHRSKQALEESDKACKLSVHYCR